MTRAVIIADDLSGAADCASAFVKAGMQTIVVIDGNAGHHAETEAAPVISIDADTRRLPADEAARIHLDLFHRYHSAGQLLYKKIDSTLRGNFAAEIASIIDQAGLAIVAPAFPSAGRFTKNGHQYLNDVPLEATEIWHGEGIAGTADIPGMLARHGIRTALIRLDEIRLGEQRVRALLDRFAGEGVQAVICDADADADLQTVAQASMALALPKFWVGSAGLANYLPAAAQHAYTPVQPATVHVSGSILTVVGSLSSVSRVQAEYLFASGQMERIDVAPGLLRLGQSHPQWQEQRDRLDGLLRQHRDVLIMTGKDDPVDMDEGLLLCTALAQLVAPFAEHVGALVSTGGETARAILSEMGATSLRLIGEIEPGVPLSVAVGIKPIPVITKAGAFGSREALLRCVETLRQARDGSARTTDRAPQDAAPPTLHRKPMYRPIIAITMGDAAGVGPEIIMKSLAARDLYDRCRPLVIGDINRLREAGELVGSKLAVHAIENVESARYDYGVVECIDLGLIPPKHPFGQLSPLCGHAAYCYIERAVELAVKQKIDAICTAPLNKEALHAGGHVFPGHTEMLAKLTNTPEVSMMLVAPNLRVIHVTTHIGLLDAIRKIEPGLVERTIARGHDTLVRSGIARPRIGVCGINPHAGENGLFGCGEEEEKIIPAVQAQRALGRSVEGPLPADTLFFRAARGDFDLVVAMYHDQGHGPVKVMGLEAGVNITVGLPVIRTSVDHGTAFDIAGKGIADERSMLEALRQAISLATRRD